MVPAGLIKGMPRHSRIALQKGSVGPLRYYEIGLTVGRDGEDAAVSLLYEQIRPFMSPRLICGGARLDGVEYFSPSELVNELLLQTALKAACYLGGIASVISPGPDGLQSAARFLPYCSEVRLITPSRIGTTVPGVDLCGSVGALEGSTVIVALSGFAGIELPAQRDLAHAAVFTNCPQAFCGGLVIDAVTPRLPPALREPPPLVSRLDFAGACYSLCGMYGLSSLTPLHIFSGKRAVGFDDIVERVQRVG